MDLNIFTQFLANAQSVYRNRPGYELAARIEDCLNKIWKDNPIYHIEKPKKHPTYWRFITTLPANKTFNQFKMATQQVLQDHVGGAVQIEKRGTAALILVMFEEIGTEYAFNLDWAKNCDKMKLPIPIGYSAKGFIVRDLARMVNLLAAGHPDSGKTNWLEGVITAVRRVRPATSIGVIDLKKSFGYLKNVLTVAQTIPHAEFVLRRLNEEIDRRYDSMDLYDVKFIEDIGLTRILLIIDELAEFSLLSQEAEANLNRLARLGRQSGVCIIAATQRPSSGVMKRFGDTKAMFPASFCFRVREDVDSYMVLGQGNNRAKLLPPTPGRGIYSWDIEIESQAMLFTKDDRIPDIDSFIIEKSTENSTDLVPIGGDWIGRPTQKLPAR